MEMLTGYGPPLLDTEGKVGQHYKDLNNGDIYKCVKVSVVTTIHFPTDADYIWELTIKGDQQADLAETDETKPGYVKNRELITQLSEEIARKDKPLVYIDGAIPTTKDEVLAELAYEHGPERWHAFVTIKCQGSSSMTYPKKNFTIKLYNDEARTVKLKKKMFGWPVESNKFVLKANWIDHTHARNIVTARLWSEVVASRPDYDTLPVGMRNSPNNGAIDGYPIIVYTNGNYQGLYTWNIGKDDWMWGMDEDNPNHVLMCGGWNTNGVFAETAANFRALWSGKDGDQWDVEIGAKNDTTATAFNRLIGFVKDSSDLDFKAQVASYFDVQSGIDYYLFSCATCGIDSFGKNLLLATYDLQHWIAGQYDLDSTWGNWVYGDKFVPADTACPDKYQEAFSLLFERLQRLYSTELKARGRELRETVLSYANIMTHFEYFCASIGKDTYADDLVPYSTIPLADEKNIWQLRNFVRDRLAYFDTWLDAIPDVVLCTGITLDKDTLTIASDEQQTLMATVAPVNATDPIRWHSSNAAIASVLDGIVTPNDNGSVTITASCGDTYTASCNVTVSGIESDDALVYRLHSPLTVSTAEDSVSTGARMVKDGDKNFTVAIDFTPTISTEDEATLFYSKAHYGNNKPYINLRSNSHYGEYIVMTRYMDQTTNHTKTGVPCHVEDSGKHMILIMRHATGSGEIEIVGYNGVERTSAVHQLTGELFETLQTTEYGYHDSARLGAAEEYDWQNLVEFGTKPAPGTYHRCEIYDRYLSDEEVTAFIDGMTE